MKRILLACMTLALSLVVSAQSKMVVTLNNGETQKYNVSEVKSVSFETESQGNFINGHEYVDLGLSVKWATCNVGATSPEDFGDYFAWGETVPKSDYSWSTYKWCKGTYNSMTKYCESSSYGTVDNKTTLELSDDAARVNWGGTWRMPTDAELTELRTKCTWTWTTKNGVNGYEVKSKTNGNSIFLPATGYRVNTDLGNVGSRGYYWSSSLYESRSDNAYDVYFTSSAVGWYYSRCYGQSVRAVCPSESVPQTTCSFSTSNRTLNVGETFTQTVTTNSDGAVTYKSSNPSVATVDASTGKVTAIAEGNATITATVAATSTYASASASYNIIVIKSSASTHEYVDLGLSVKWATCNVGATSPEEYGDYFAWGETEPKNDYSWSTYKWCKGSEPSQTKYCTSSSYGTVDNKTTLELSDDAARVNWGGTWRMPTKAELDELREKCTWTWTTKNGVKGYEVKSKTNGNSIFLPAAGYRVVTYLYGAGSYGECWSSSLYESYSGNAYELYFYSGGVSSSHSPRDRGRSVRAVCP